MTFFFKDFIYLRKREREREHKQGQEAGAKEEGEAGSSMQGASQDPGINDLS